METQNIILVCVIGYLIGSIHPSYLIGKLKGIDIREHGSKNAGAANITMSFGWVVGVFTGILDMLKAVVAVHLAKYFITLEPFNLLAADSFNTLPFLAGALAVIGHNYPFYMNFKGGKGTASAVGLMIGFDPLWGVIMIGVLILSTIITNYLVAGTINIYLVMIYLAVFKYAQTEIIIISILLAILGIYKHRMNFKRILDGSEPTFRGTL
jgi:glycerol-3-phosphate acyltransferase PlsY